MQNSDYTMPPKISSPGCAIGGGVALVGILFFGFLFFSYRHKGEAVRRETHAIEKVAHRDSRQNSGVRIEQAHLSNYSPTDFGDSLTAEHFVAVHEANNITSLAREMFIDAATDHPIEWNLQLVNIHKLNADRVAAEFNLPYQFYHQNSSTGSGVRITANFSTDSIPDLAELRRNAWVTVSGKLSFNPSNNSRNRIEIKDASIISKPLPN